EIRIAVDLRDISDEDLDRLEDSHRAKLSLSVVDGALTLVRVYGTDGKSRIRQVTRVPKDNRFDAEYWRPRLTGKTGKDLRSVVIEIFPELSPSLGAKPTQTEVKSAIEGLVAAMATEQLEDREVDLVTGIDKSILPLLPEPLPVYAVKDLAGDMRYKDGVPFGKIIKVLLNVLESELDEEQAYFDKLNRQLNTIIGAEGTVADERCTVVKDVEMTMQRLLRESFPSVTLELRIPPPQIKTILEGTRISVNDGVKSPVELKGDGLKRAVVFSIFRAYEEISRKYAKPGRGKASAPQYVLLFEEPELYLHPKAQHILFNALAAFSRDHHVLVTTHSPSFLGPNDTTSFVKMSKVSASDENSRAYSVAMPVDLRDVSRKGQFQFICYENNNHAFFAQTVVLVEGPSDELVLGHMARTLRADWNSHVAPIAFAKIGGKGSIAAYRHFFRAFGVRVIVVADLDIVINGFNKLETTEGIQEKHNSLLAHLNDLLSQENDPEPTRKALKRVRERGDIQANWKNALTAYDIWLEKQDSLDAVKEALDEFFGHAYDDQRMLCLMSTENPTTVRLKDDLIRSLYDEDVFILHNGELEDYYPSDCQSGEKTERAVAYCETYTSTDRVRKHLLSKCKCFGDGRSEFEVLFGAVFGTDGMPELVAASG
ncbi:MAG TPA: AAA family ATPase, partial [Bryobacteraceae bacterium]|nr:AAA family ATPase [Bryobacteraceae bacterium]